jgi:hypothetical protein
LVDGEQEVGDLIATYAGSAEDVAEADVFEVADEGAGGFGEG